MITPPDQGLSYAEAGVDVSAYDHALHRLQALAASTYTQDVKAGVGPFAGLYRIPGEAQYLAATADGVGTKVKVAVALGQHDGIGHDLVNHCANDIAVAGAKPLFFLDYFACGGLDEDVLLQVMEGLAAACRSAGCALLGGETAEMPGLYALGDYDLAGFMVGAVDPDRVPRPEHVSVDDILLAMPSNGLHTNGYSLARLVFADVDLEALVPELGTSLGAALVKPHALYASQLARLWPLWKTAAHITGGGLVGNLPRALPEDVAARLDRSAWQVPGIFKLIQQRGRVADEEMFGTFNMGLGMVVSAAPDAAAELQAAGLVRVGKVAPRGASGQVVFD